MGFLSDHYGVINPIEQLVDHNIGISKKYNLLFYQNDKTLYCLTPDFSPKWIYSSSETIYDFTLNQVGGLIFFVTTNYIECLSLINGEPIWKVRRKSGWTNSIMSYSHKNGLIYEYVSITGNNYINVYDYNGSHVQEINRSINEFAFSDNGDAMVYRASDRLFSTDKNFTPITNAGSDFSVQTFVLEKETDKIHLLTNKGLRETTPRTLNASTLIGAQTPYLLIDETTASTDKEGYIYISRVGSGVNNLIKVDKATGQQVYSKVIRRLSATTNISSLTQDADFLYQYVSSEQSDGNLYKIRKSDGEIVAQHPLNALDIRLLHTYDSLT